MFPYPLTVQLIRLRQPIGAFQFGVTGPPGVYAVLASTDLAVWSEWGAVTNSLGAILFTDVAAHLSPQKFYRALLQVKGSVLENGYKLNVFSVLKTGAR